MYRKAGCPVALFLRMEFGGCGSFDSLRLLRTTEKRGGAVLLNVILSEAS